VEVRAMTEGQMLYLIIVVAAALTFVATLFWGMIATSPPSVGTHARTAAAMDAAPQKG
jgi:hypothetical protein